MHILGLACGCDICGGSKCGNAGLENDLCNPCFCFHCFVASSPDYRPTERSVVICSKCLCLRSTCKNCCLHLRTDVTVVRVAFTRMPILVLLALLHRPMTQAQLLEVSLQGHKAKGKRDIWPGKW